MNIYRFTPAPMATPGENGDQATPTEQLYSYPRGDNGPCFVSGFCFDEEVVRQYFDQETIEQSFTPCGELPLIPHRVENLHGLEVIARGVREWIISEVGQTVCREIDDRCLPAQHVPYLGGQRWLFESLCELNAHSLRLGSTDSFRPDSRIGKISETKALELLNRLIEWTTVPAVWLGDNRFQVGERTWELDEVDAKVLSALVRLRAANTTSLVASTSLDDCVKILKQIKNKYPELSPYIHVPGAKGRGGYRTTIIDGSSTPPTSLLTHP